MIFPPAFLDSSSCWNTNHNQLQLHQLTSNNITITPSPAAGGGAGGAGAGGGGGNNHPSQDGSMATAAGGGGGGGGAGGGGGEGDGDGGPNKPMSMSERARLARVPQPEPGLNCPRCDSTNTKFCYFNNYSLTQPRHFCRACRRYWTRGGALRNVPVGGGYRRHAKRSTKPKSTAAGAAAAGAGTSSTTSTTPSSATTCTGSATAVVPPGMQYSMFSNSAPPHGRFTDGFDPASLGLSFPARLLFADNGAYASDANGHHHQGNGMEQWAAAQMQSFPFLHAMDHQMAGNQPPSTMAAMQGMFHLGLQSGGGGGGRGNGEDGGHQQFHHQATPAAKRDQEHHQQPPQQDYPSSRGMYGTVLNGGGYNFYSSASNAAGN
uniref:Uncharacterized protein n=1 Tax=Avena sativa TaxID=4498 RepID=A0ACD5WLZ2_AVESA